MENSSSGMAPTIAALRASTPSAPAGRMQFRTMNGPAPAQYTAPEMRPVTGSFENPVASVPQAPVEVPGQVMPSVPTGTRKFAAAPSSVEATVPMSPVFTAAQTPINNDANPVTIASLRGARDRRRRFNTVLE